MTVKVKYLILGGGPSGLTLAAQLLRLGESSFLILEKENEVGGLCRSMEVDNSPLDTGGGHFLDIHRKTVLDFVFSFLPGNDWECFDRISKIKTSKFEIDYPYESNIWQLPIEDQIEHLISIATTGSNTGKPQPDKFSEWISWKSGTLIANNYLLPYNSKIFSDIRLDDLGTYWLYKLPCVSFEDTLRSCFYKKPYGNLPAHSQFYYPKSFGFGEVFRRISDFIGNKRILQNYSVKNIDPEELMINKEINAEMIINTIPWLEFRESSSIPLEIKNSIDQLKFSSIDVSYNSSTQPTNAFWSYFSDVRLPYHRVLYRQNFITGAKGYWEETNSKRIKEGQLITYHNKYAYPLNTLDKPEAIKNVLKWAGSRSIIGLGRWGEWEHMNSDVAIEKALQLAESLVPE